MIKNYFSIERAGQCLDHIYLVHNDGKIAFEDIMGMSYDELKTYDNISEFITTVMDVSNAYFQDGDAQTIINLVDENNIFIWGILIGPGDTGDNLRYAFIDWHKDGKNYRYEQN